MLDSIMEKNPTAEVCGVIAAALLIKTITVEALEFAAFSLSPQMTLLAGGVTLLGVIAASKIKDRLAALKCAPEKVLSR